jgi:hypothetical protein
MIITVCLGGTVCMLTLAKIIWKLSTPICMRFLKTSTTMTAGGHATGLPWIYWTACLFNRSWRSLIIRVESCR